MRNIITFLVLIILLLPATSFADEKGACYSTFYLTKNMDCIDEVVGLLKKSPPSNQKNPAIIGFLAQIFVIYPKEKERLLHQEIPPHVKSIYLASLYRAGLQEDVEEYAQKHGITEEAKTIEVSRTPKLKDISPEFDAGDNDLLIGAYMASGDITQIQRILANFSSAESMMVGDALRMSLMHSKFGPSLTPQGREKTMAIAACHKYECKSNMQKTMRLMTLSSAFWALQSLSQKDDAIKNAFITFFGSDPRLQQLLATERVAFSNYLTMLVAFAAVKDDAGINSSLTIYEQLGSAEDAANAMIQKK